MKKLEAVIFDYDGTIVDTESEYFNVMKELIKENFGKEIDKLEYIRNVSGTTCVQCKKYITQKYNVDDESYNKLEKDMISMLEKKVSSKIILPYIEETFKLLKENGIKIGVASNGSLDNVINGLKKIGLFDYVDDVVTKDEVDNPKPFPDLYLYASARLGVDIKNCIAVEDSKPGALAASRAGACLILQTNGITKYFDYDDVDYKYKDCNLFEVVKSYI